MIDLARNGFTTLKDKIYLGDKQIKEIWMDNKKIYPSSGRFKIEQTRVRVFNNSIYAIGYFSEDGDGWNTKDYYKLFGYVNNAWYYVADLPSCMPIDEFVDIGGRMALYNSCGRTDTTCPFEVYNNRLYILNYPIRVSDGQHATASVTGESGTVYKFCHFNLTYLDGFSKYDPYPLVTLPEYITIYNLSVKDIICSCIYNGSFYVVGSLSYDLNPGGGNTYLYYKDDSYISTGSYDQSGWRSIASFSDADAIDMFTCNGSLYVVVYHNHYTSSYDLYRLDGDSFTHVNEISTRDSYSPVIFPFNGNVYSLTRRYSGSGGRATSINILNGSSWTKIGETNSIYPADHVSHVEYLGKAHLFVHGVNTADPTAALDTHYTWDGTTWTNLGTLEV